MGNISVNDEERIVFHSDDIYSYIYNGSKGNPACPACGRCAGFRYGTSCDCEFYKEAAGGQVERGAPEKSDIYKIYNWELRHI